MVNELVEAYHQGLLKGDSWDQLMEHLQHTQLKRKTLCQCLRLALTGRHKGHSLSELLQLLELMELGAPWSSEIVPLAKRMSLLTEWLRDQKLPANRKTEASASCPRFEPFSRYLEGLLEKGCHPERPGLEATSDVLSIGH